MLPPYAPGQHQARPRRVDQLPTTPEEAAIEPLPDNTTGEWVAFLQRIAALIQKSDGQLPFPGSIYFTASSGWKRIQLSFWERDGVTLASAQQWCAVFGMAALKQSVAPHEDQWWNHGRDESHLVDPEIAINWTSINKPDPGANAGPCSGR